MVSSISLASEDAHGSRKSDSGRNSHCRVKWMAMAGAGLREEKETIFFWGIILLVGSHEQ